MTVLLLASAGVLMAAMIASVVVAARSGETRVMLLAGVFLLLGVPQGVALWQHWGQPLTLDLAAVVATASLAAGLLGLAAVVGIACGAAQWPLVAIAAAISLVMLTLLRLIEPKDRDRRLDDASGDEEEQR